jgi:hypothetical protein
MQTELMDAIHKNNVSTFSYSRAPGTGLRVPKHTDVKGDPTRGNASSVIEGALATRASTGVDIIVEVVELDPYRLGRRMSTRLDVIAHP